MIFKLTSSIPRPPPISINPTLRRTSSTIASNNNQVVSNIPSHSTYLSSTLTELELLERLDWDLRRGRNNQLSIRRDSDGSILTDGTDSNCQLSSLEGDDKQFILSLHQNTLNSPSDSKNNHQSSHLKQLMNRPENVTWLLQITRSKKRLERQNRKKGKYDAQYTQSSSLLN
ncbi:hypothetical protein BY996DRAFT_6480125 [Phakopsora pachyrhizi]|nr:hypothetical protein BY996DRAFT_6480125 [Phakopsora pachyrhizi]